MKTCSCKKGIVDSIIIMHSYWKLKKKKKKMKSSILALEAFFPFNEIRRQMFVVESAGIKLMALIILSYEKEN